MANDEFQLSRRKALAALGTVGVASAGAGLGTSAYFSDQETFENNRLVAGELDLKMDWEEHYSDWSPDENDLVEGEFEVHMDEPEDAGAYKAFPPGADSPELWVPVEYVSEFMDNTSVEAYPDENNDGIAEFPVEEMNERTPCDFLADVGDDDAGLDPDSDPLGRTDAEGSNGDTVLENGEPAPLINLQDVKPGDFGEVTFSTHLCDNDGYLWMNMPGGLTLSENGVNEPEGEDPDEEAGVVELADEIQTALWYDNNCDNLITCEEPIDLMAVVDTSQSITGDLTNADAGEEVDLVKDAGNELIRELQARAASDDQVRAGLLTFNGGQDEGAAVTDPTVDNQPVLRADIGPLDQFDTDSDGDPELENFLPNTGFGDTPMPQALDLAQKILADQGRPEAQPIILLVTDGFPEYENGASYTVNSPTTSATYTSDAYSAMVGTSTEQSETSDEADQIKADGIDILGVGIDLDPGTGETFLVNQVVGSDADPSTAEPNFFVDASFATFEEDAELVAQRLIGGDAACDEVIFTGSLRELEGALSGNEGRGLPLDGNRGTGYDELAGEGVRECFTASMTHCFGFSWWLPLDHGNEVQTDSAQFDLGFYTEQCRHNDGSGMNAEDVDA